MSKIYPDKIDTFILAENLRPEAGGKISIMGAYAAGEIIIGDDTPLPANFPLAFYVLFTTGVGEFRGRLRTISPDNVQISDIALTPTHKRENAPLTLLINFAMISLPSIGKYTAELYLDDRKYPLHFTLMRGVIPK